MKRQEYNYKILNLVKNNSLFSEELKDMEYCIKNYPNQRFS